MSYVVRGREIPPTCSQCNYRYYDEVKNSNFCQFTDEEIWNVCRGDGCHLLELPEKHGRLVDVDGLLETVKWSKKDTWTSDEVRELIADAITIVPAEADPDWREPDGKTPVAAWWDAIDKWAWRLHGREYGSELTAEEAAEAKEDGIVIVYGFSDDNMEFDGALHDEVDCFDGGVARVSKFGIYTNEVPDKTELREIRAVWCAPGKPSWSYETDIPHATFNICEDGELYCEGIVFSLDHLFDTVEKHNEPYDLLYEEGGATTTR